MIIKAVFVHGKSRSKQKIFLLVLFVSNLVCSIYLLSFEISFIYKLPSFLFFICVSIIIRIAACWIDGAIF